MPGVQGSGTQVFYRASHFAGAPHVLREKKFIMWKKKRYTRNQFEKTTYSASVLVKVTKNWSWDFKVMQFLPCDKK